MFGIKQIDSKSNTWISVDDFFLKPNLLLLKILLDVKCVINLLYITFTKIFENAVNNEIGLQLVTLFLSPFYVMELC